MEPINWAALKDNCVDDDALVKEVLELFRAEAPALLGDVRTAVGNGDAAAVKRSAHRLKGALLSLVAEPSATAARDLEHMGSANSLSQSAEVLARLEAEMARLIAALGAKAQAA